MRSPRTRRRSQWRRRTARGQQTAHTASFRARARGIKCVIMFGQERASGRLFPRSTERPVPRWHPRRRAAATIITTARRF